MLKIGILDALSPNVADIDWGGEPADTYIRFFDTVNAPFEFNTYRVALGELPATPLECDAYLITGSINGVYDEEGWITELSQFIRECYLANKKLVGICFGHQMLAYSLGGQVEKSEKGENFGLARFELSKYREWMAEQVDSLSLHFVHQDQIISLPANAVCLGGNSFCPIALFEIENRVLGIQGHPEFSRKIMLDILPFIKENIHAENYEKFAASLYSDEPDSRQVAKWIANFLTQDSKVVSKKE